MLTCKYCDKPIRKEMLGYMSKGPNGEYKIMRCPKSTYHRHYHWPVSVVAEPVEEEVAP